MYKRNEGNVKIKYIKILLLLLLCVFCLVGCQKPENEKTYYEEKMLDEVTETINTDATEKANESESVWQENKQSDKEEVWAECDSIDIIKKYMIPEQSFDIFLDDWGNVTFVSRRPTPDEYKDWKVASFYLIKDEQILYKFPYRFENNSSRGYIGLFDGVGAVAFRDINNDKKDDIIIITYYVSGAGPTGMVPRPSVTIYLAGENEFYLAEDMIEDVEEHIVEKDRTIERVCDFLKHRE